MKSMPTKLRTMAIALAALAGGSMTANAQLFTFNNGDVILGFQATGGTGATQNVFFNLGATTTIRDNPNQGVIGNINTTLSNVFGNDWYTRTDVYAGAFGNLNFTTHQSPFFTAPVNGDPSRTVYVSAPATGINQSTAWSGYGAASSGTAGSNFSGLENVVAGLTANADGSATLDQTSKPVEWNNSWTAWNPTPGSAFGIYAGGIQNNFGIAQNEYVYLDVFRILATNTGASPTGTVGTGSWETTIRIGGDGSISAVPEPSTAALLGLGTAAFFALMRRRKAQA